MQLNVLHPAITFQEKTDTFSVELSDIDHTYPELYRAVSKGDPIDLHNPKTGGRLKATRVEVHQDPSGEDTYGWLYHAYNPENGRNVKFLFIND